MASDGCSARYGAGVRSAIEGDLRLNSSLPNSCASGKSSQWSGFAPKAFGKPSNHLGSDQSNAGPFLFQGTTDFFLIFVQGLIRIPSRFPKLRNKRRWSVVAAITFHRKGQRCVD